MSYLAVFLLLTPLLQSTLTAPLESYPVDRNQISVSGISAGGAMATQVHVAFSQKIMGCGVVAGIPYYCAEGALGQALTCMSTPAATNVNALIAQVNTYAGSGVVDDPVNMQNDRVYVFHGTLDGTVRPGNGDNIVTFYDAFLQNPAENIFTNMDMAADHGFATDKVANNPCSSSRTPYINYCQLDSAFEMLNFIYGGGLTQPSGNVPINGDILLYDQTEFVEPSLPGYEHMDDEGFIYVPSGCRNIRTALPSGEKEEATCFIEPDIRTSCLYVGVPVQDCLNAGCCYDQAVPNPEIHCYHSGETATTLPPGATTTTTPPADGSCKLHIALHGCLMGRQVIGDDFVRLAGYLEVAELNNIVVIFPQILRNLIFNPNGCFDWWGYKDDDYANKNGAQMDAINQMVDRILGDNPRRPVA